MATLAISDTDFTNSVLGNPKRLALYATRDGNRKKVTEVAGFRGSRDLNVSFEMDYDSQSRYEFTIEEVTALSPGQTWSLSSVDTGNWPFRGRIAFGRGSTVTFVDEKVP